MLEMSSQSAPAARHSGPSSLAYNLAGIAVLVLLLAVGMAYLIDSLGRTSRVPAPALDDAEPVSQTISGRELSIPASWVRYGEQVRDGFTSQIDLRILYAPDGATARPGRGCAARGLCRRAGRWRRRARRGCAGRSGW